MKRAIASIALFCLSMCGRTTAELTEQLDLANLISLAAVNRGSSSLALTGSLTDSDGQVVTSSEVRVVSDSGADTEGTLRSTTNSEGKWTVEVPMLGQSFRKRVVIWKDGVQLGVFLITIRVGSDRKIEVSVQVMEGSLKLECSGILGPGAGNPPPATILPVAISLDRIGLTVLEGATQTFSVRLTNKPQMSIVLNLTKDLGSPSSFASMIQIQPATLTFTPNNFDQPQTVSVEGLQDAGLIGGWVSVKVAAVDQPEIAPAYLAVTVNDDDALAAPVSLGVVGDFSRTMLVGTRLAVAVAPHALNGYQHALLFCQRDGTACTNVAPATAAQFHPDLAWDPINSKVLMAGYSFHDPAPKLHLTRCNADGSSCTNQILVQGANGSSALQFPRLGVDTVNSKLVVAYRIANTDVAMLLRCELDGTGCATVNVSGISGVNAWRPEILVDNSAQQVLAWSVQYQQNYGPQNFVRCNLTMTACATQSLDGAGFSLIGTTYLPAVWDPARSRALLGRMSCPLGSGLCVSRPTGQAGRLVHGNFLLDWSDNRFYRCNADGLDCFMLELPQYSRIAAMTVDVGADSYVAVTEEVGNAGVRVYRIPFTFAD